MSIPSAGGLFGGAPAPAPSGGLFGGSPGVSFPLSWAPTQVLPSPRRSSPTAPTQALVQSLLATRFVRAQHDRANAERTHIANLRSAEDEAFQQLKLAADEAFVHQFFVSTHPTRSASHSNVEKKASLASVCSGPSGPLPAIWGLSRRFGEARCLRGLADLRLRIVARPTRAPRVERSLESPFHLPVRPRLILPHPWFCRYEHLVQQHQQQKAQSSATAHGMRGRRRRGRRSRAQRHMWHKSAATPREVRARLGPATAHGIGELVAKVGYSRRHGGAPQHR